MVDRSLDLDKVTLQHGSKGCSSSIVCSQVRDGKRMASSTRCVPPSHEAKLCRVAPDEVSYALDHETDLLTAEPSLPVRGAVPQILPSEYLLLL